MRRLKMASRVWAFLLAACISVCSSALPAAASETEMSSEAVPKEEGPVLTDLDRANEIVRLTQQLMGELDNVDIEELKSDMDLIIAVVSSEEFQSLISYQDVRELFEIVIIRLGKMAMEEPELAGKIFVTMGVDQKIVDALIRVSKLLEESDTAQELFLLALSQVNPAGENG